MKLNASRTFKGKHATVTIVDQPIEITEVELGGAADAIAANVRSSIESQPGKRWDKTGHLKAGIAGSENGVSAPGDRLQRPELAEKFMSEVVEDSTITAPNVDKALGAALDEAIQVKK